MNHFLLITITLLLASVGRLEAMSTRDRPQQLMWLLQYSIELCREEGVELESITWPMVTKHLNTNTPSICPLPFDEMFQLMEKNKVVHPVSGDQLIAVMSMTLTGSKYPEAGRYMLWWNGRHFDKTFETEQKASEILRASGVTLIKRGSWPIERLALFNSGPQSKRPTRSPDEQREWLIQTRIEDGHDFGKPKPTREEVVKKLVAEGLIEPEPKSYLGIIVPVLVAAVLALVLWRSLKRRELPSKSD